MSNTPSPLKKALSEALASMRSDAAWVYPQLDRLMKQTSCADDTRIVESGLSHWDRNNQENGEGIMELEILNSCPIDMKLLPQIADYATNTEILRARYWAVRIINKWANANVDPFDTTAIQNWWKTHKAQYQTQNYKH